MRARTGTPYSIYSITNSKLHVILIIIDAFSYFLRMLMLVSCNLVGT